MMMIKKYKPKRMKKNIIHPALEEYKCGNYSPIYITANDLDPGTIVMTEAEDGSKREIDQSRARKGSKVDNVMNAEEKALEKEAKKGMNLDEEASFAVESALQQSPHWFRMEQIQSDTL